MIILSEYEQQYLENQESYYWKVKAKAFEELYRAKCEELRSILQPDDAHWEPQDPAEYPERSPGF